MMAIIRNMRLFFLVFGSMIGLGTPCAAQLGPEWPSGSRVDSIPSTYDGSLQPVLLRVVPGDAPRPLVVSLHSWSGDYLQKDTLAHLAAARGYHYVHPNFRGANRHPQACGSPAAIQDIDDAITYLRRMAAVDTAAIHVVGASGGGHATMMAYLHTRQPVRTFSAWVGISDMEAWFYQCQARGLRYAGEIAAVTQSQPAGPGVWTLDVAQARRRSPLHLPVPIAGRAGSTLYLYAGIHDGYEGSVPISHTLHFFNKVVMAFAPDDQEALIPEPSIQTMLRERQYAWPEEEWIEGREVHFHKAFRELVEVTIFEGGHEMLPQTALRPLLER